MLRNSWHHITEIARKQGKFKRWNIIFNNLYQFIPGFAALGAFIISYFLLPIVISVSHDKHLFDDPSDSRKLHTTIVPNLGGVAIFVAVLLPFLLSGTALQAWSPYLVAGLLVVFFSGLKDDIMIISAWKKLSFQLLAIGALILGGNMVITDLGGVFGIHEIPVWAGIAITFFTMVVVVNSYNLIDGIDGLAAGIGTIASLFFGGWFWYIGLYAEATVSFTLAGALTAFLFYNFEPASIFMGDTGSQVVGFILAFLAVRFVDFGISTDMAVPFKNEVPVLILALLIVPLYDTLRVFCIRCFQKQSPFTSDQLHVHHQLLNMGFSHGKTCLIIYSVNLSIIGMTILLSGSDVNFLFFAVLGGAIGMFSTFGIKRKILASMGIRMPSARNITTQKERLGLNEKKVGRDSKVGASNGINRDGVEKEKEEEMIKV